MAKENSKRTFKGTNLSEEGHDIKTTAKGWQKEFTRIKREYSAHIAKLNQCGCARDVKIIHYIPEY